jgi:hypothetical protein
MSWPAETLRAAGHDVTVIAQSERELLVHLDKHGRVMKVVLDPEVDVVVMQRTTHDFLVGVIGWLTEHGVAVVVDVDDDLSAIHPSNPAWTALHPKGRGVPMDNGAPNMHSWHNLTEACRIATLVTVSTPALLPIYAAHGRGAVLPNCLPDHYYGLERVDSDIIGWPASLHSHPNDPAAVGNAIARLVGQGAEFRVVSDPAGVGRAFGLAQDPPGSGAVGLMDWPARIAELGIGIAPLADTRFNRAKSFLKPLELSATGTPWVASPRAEYAKLHAQGAGLLADRPRDWVRALQRLRGSADLRAELSENGRAVAARWRIADHADRWLAAWEQAADLVGPRPGRSLFKRAATPTG